MANETQDKKKARNREALVSVVSVGSLVSAFGAWYQVDAYVNKIIESRIAVLKPNNDHIRGICKELIAEERERSKEREEQLRESIDFLMRYYRRR
jgi:uncharacterized protein YydD (DUF2326 family)